MSYEELLIESEKNGLIVKELQLKTANGRITGNRIAIRQDISTLVEKACVLAEEIGHFHTGSGNILDQSVITNKKVEMSGRLWAYNKQIGLSGIIQGCHAKCENNYELAEFLGVTEEFLREALSCYRKKYGTYVEFNGYSISFEPYLSVTEKQTYKKQM